MPNCRNRLQLIVGMCKRLHQTVAAATAAAARTPDWFVSMRRQHLLRGGATCSWVAFEDLQFSLWSKQLPMREQCLRAHIKTRGIEFDSMFQILSLRINIAVSTSLTPCTALLLLPQAIALLRWHVSSPPSPFPTLLLAQ